MSMLERRSAVKQLVSDRGDMLVVAGLGSPVYDVYASGDHPLNFYNWGSMGSAAMVGLGLALAQPDRPVTVFTGDGEMLMGIGSFSTIAQHQPPNLSILVLDNGEYAETGMQKTATSWGTRLDDVAKAAGIAETGCFTAEDQLAGLKAKLHAKSGPFVGVLKIGTGDVPRTTPLRDGVVIKHRFLEAMAS